MSKIHKFFSKQKVDWVDTQGNLYPASIEIVGAHEIVSRLERNGSARYFHWCEFDGGGWISGCMTLLPRRNLVLCRSCLTVLESTHRHDFVQCGCENHTFTDGGTDYTRIGGADLSMVEVLDGADGFGKPRRKSG